MKTMPFFGLALVVLLASSCQQKAHETHQKEAPEPPSGQMAPCPELREFQVFNTTAELWKEAWASVQSNRLAVTPEQLTDAQLFRTFPTDLLVPFLTDSVVEVNGVQQTFPDVRVYFAKVDPADPSLIGVPDLIMVNANDCKDDTQSNALMATSGGAAMTPHADVVTYIQRWSESAPVDSVFYPVLAYTFSRKAIMETLDTLQTDLDVNLNFYYAIHARDKLRKKQGQFASVQGFLVTDLVMGPSVAGEETSGYYVNFAQPCPELCDTGSAYYMPPSNSLLN